MFDFILYPVSAILWFWHKVFGTVFGPNTGIAWALAVFFLVFSLRVLLLKPAISQIRAARKMQKFAPQIQKLREKYKGDKQRLQQEMQKLQQEQGVNPLGGCLPALVQIPVFLSLVNVLRNFHPGSPSNYIFNRADVQSFVDANIFGAKLSAIITWPDQQLTDFGTTRTEMIIVGVPLMIVASAATYFTMRLSQKRQTDVSMANPQSAMMGKLMMYIAPIGALVSGWFLPLALLLYWLANNTWTLGQSHFLSNKVDREQEREKEREIAAKKAAPRPKPGQKPAQRADAATSSSAAEEPAAQAQSDAPEKAGQPGEAAGKTAGNKTNGQHPGSKPARKPQPKNRPGKQAAAPKKSQKKRR